MMLFLENYRSLTKFGLLYLVFIFLFNLAKNRGFLLLREVGAPYFFPYLETTFTAFHCGK